LKTYYPTINLLRAIATIGVCLVHFIGYKDFRGTLFTDDNLFSWFVSHGASIVFVFFVISGFVIPLSLMKEEFKITQPLKFLAKRFIRIEIPYIVSILLILFFGLLFTIKNNTEFTLSAERFVYHILYFVPFSSHEWYNPIYWTLAIEFQYYIIMSLMHHLFTSKRKLVVITALVLFGASAFVISDNRLVFHYSCIFLQGIILLLIKSERINSTLGTLLILICIVCTAHLHSIEIAIVSTLSVCAIQWLEINRKTINRLSEISYSLYLTHGLIGGNLLYLFSRYITGYTGKIFLVIASLVSSLVFSYVYWRLIESPAKKLTKKINIA